MRGMAYVMYRALRSSGVAWPLVRPAPAADGLSVVTARADARRKTAERERAGRGVTGLQGLLDRAARAWTRPWTQPHGAS
jgi:hypothetical protein